MNVRMYECTNVRMYECTNVRKYESTNVRIYECTNVVVVRRVLTEVTVYVHKSLRSNWQRVPSHLGVQLQASPPLPEPSTTNNCWPLRAEKVGTHVRVDGVRKMQQNAAKTLPQSVMTLSMSESEATPGRRCCSQERRPPNNGRGMCPSSTSRPPSAL